MLDGTTVDFDTIKRDLRRRADSAPHVESKPPSGLIDAAKLQNQRFPPIKYVIPGYVPEGLSILAGKPKLGKSWLSLDWAVAVAWGGTAMESIRCTQGDVLYAALEDNPRRLQSRMRTLIPDPEMPWPARLQFATSMDTLDQGGVEFVRDWIEAASDPRLVIVDTLQKVRGSRSDRETAYEGDYKAVAALQALAAEKGVAIVLVHHVRKLEADDPIDKVSGTLGLTGCADTTLVLDRKGGGDVTLYGRGRDTEEIEQAVQFGKDSCRWSILGDAGQVAKSTERGRVFEALADAPEPMTATEIASLAEMTVDNARRLLSRMMKDGEVERVKRGRYCLPSEPDPDGGSDTSDSASETSDRTAHEANPGPTCPNVRSSPETAENCASEGAKNRTDFGQPVRNGCLHVENRTGPIQASPICEPPKTQNTADRSADRTDRTDRTGGGTGPKPDGSQTDIEDFTAQTADRVPTEIATVDVRLFGGTSAHGEGRKAYRIGPDQAPVLEARGWVSVHETRLYVFLQPPKGVEVIKNKAKVEVEVPTEEALERLAQAAHEAGVEESGEIAGWAWRYTPVVHKEGRYETRMTTDGPRKEWRPACKQPARLDVGQTTDVWGWTKRFGEAEVGDA